MVPDRRPPFAPMAIGILLAAAVLLAAGCGSGPSDVVDDEPDDVTPPATVADLRVASPTPVSLTLRWTAPGDDGQEGFAVAYDLRAAQTPITSENFDAAVVIDLEGSPLPPGVTEDVLIDALEPGQAYHFALKAIDDAGNISGMSNCACGTCLVEQTIDVPDANLEQLLRESLQVPAGDLHLSDMLRLTELGGEGRGIVDLTGLEAAHNLRLAGLLGNQISDPTPLGQLSSLEGLNLTMNQLTDISPLQDLTGLQSLHCGQNQLSDITVVAGMTELRSLSVHANPLTDLSPLAGLARLTSLNIGCLGLTDLAVLDGKPTLEIVVANGNQIDDISALADLPALAYVDLGSNEVADLAPLVENTAFAADAQLDVRNNPLSPTALEAQIPALIARGVTVLY